MYKRQTQSLLSILFIALSPLPVSYTHLDVYKRQVPADVVREEDDGHTRIRAIVAIDPEGFLAPPTATHGRAQAPAPSDVTAPGGIEGGGTTATEASPAATTPVDTDQRVVTDHGPHTRPEAVSYTHLDVYKRQDRCCRDCFPCRTPTSQAATWRSPWKLSLIHI